MLTSGEFNKVLALLRRNREICQERNRDDKIISGVYNKRASTHLVLGASCNHGQSLRNVKEAATTQVVKEEKTTAKPETKIIKFNEGQPQQPQQQQQAQHPQQQQPTTPRGLTKPGPLLGPRALSPLSTPSASPSSAPSSFFKKEKVGTPVTQKSLIQIVEPAQGRKKEVTVWVYDNPKAVGSATHTLKVLVPEEGKILDVIVETRKIVSKDKAAEQGSSDPNDYNLYIAEDDGRPDDDIALGPTQDIKKLGREFVLVPKRRQTLSLTRSQTSIVKIQLPAGQYHTVAFQPDLKIKDLLFQVCTRWNLDATEHAFRVGARGHADVPVDITMKDLDTHTNGKNNLFLVKKDIKPEEEAPPEVPIWDRMGSITLKQYEVAKIKKFSKRQDRILGISGEMITNDSPAKKKGKTTKRPVRFIKDVKSVEQNKKKDNQFIIKFSDNKSYTYEAKSPEIAREIVQKITTCMELKNNNAN